MGSTCLNAAPPAVPDRRCAAVAGATITAAIAGLSAAWFAAGSTGCLAHGLRHALTWAAVAVAVLVAWPKGNGRWAARTVVLCGVFLALGISISASSIVNTLAVAVVLASLAHVNGGLAGRVLLIPAFAAVVLASYRLAAMAIPTVWLASDAVGRASGHVVGWLTGRSLEIGPTFGGVDFLVAMAAVYAGWLIHTSPPRRKRALYAAVAILVAHFSYLVALAYSETWLGALGDAITPLEPDINLVGVWTWSGFLRATIPWNLPLLAVLFYGTIAAVMFRTAAWLPVAEDDAAEAKRREEVESTAAAARRRVATDLFLQFGPVLLAALIPVAVVLVANTLDLKGKTVVAFDDGGLDWRRPEYERDANGRYGMLPLLVDSLGGHFVKSADLAEKDLAAADVLLLIQTDAPWKKEVVDRAWQYARRGGSLLVVAAPQTDKKELISNFNDALQPTAMKLRNDTAIAGVDHWEQSYEAMLHLAGCNVDDLRNRFGIERAGTLHVHWPARPVLVGRWGQAKPAESGQTANRLSDLVLAAEQPLGQGRIFVLAGTSPLANETLTNAYPFVGRLLVYLANPSSMPQAGWRQLLGIVGIAAMIGFLAWRPAAWPIGLTSVVLSASLIGCIAKSETACRVLPDGRPHTPNNIAYIDASHLEAYSTDLWSRRGIAGFLRTLMRHGYLPLLLPEVTQERLERAGLLISIAPSREFSPDERAAVRAFVNRGGTFFCMVGGEEAGVLGPFLRQEFDLAVPVSPVGPTESAIEPKPIGGFKQVFSDLGGKRQYVQFHAGWPVECDEKQATPLVYWSDGTTNLPIVVYQPEQRGAVVVIGDTYFATNENLEMQDGPASGNVHFWRWLISRTVGGQTAWEPPADLPEDRSPTDDESNDE